MIVTGLAKSFGARTLFEGVAFQLDPGQRMAVVGPNGAGKTTLLRILAGQLEPDTGEVVTPRGTRIALHDQRPPIGRDLSLGAYVAEGLSEMRAIEARLASAEARLAGGDHGPEALAEYQRARDALDRAGGYEWEHRVERVLRGLGLPPEEMERPLASFSGGELTRASLARSLVAAPDALLLDEPTNHLDLDSTEWLEQAVCDLAASVVLVSHDRWFLESVATSVLEIDAGRAKLWPMGYSAFRRARAEAIDRQSAEAERQAKEIARLERFVARWSAGTKSRQAQSRKKALGRIERVPPPSRETHLAFGFPRAERTGRLVIDVDGLGIAAGERELVTESALVVERGQRVAVVAPNGTGKTTLIETLVGRRRPAAGRITLGHKVAVGYFSQHAAELDERQTVVEAVVAGNTLTAGQARTLLGRFGLSGAEADKRIEMLSGGERRKVSLVRLIGTGPNLLVLDEPTNHLDIESREALEEALLAFDGTVLFVSHDRALIDLVATHTVAIEDRHLVMRLGGYRDLVEARSQVAGTGAPEPPPKVAKAPRPKGGEESQAPPRSGGGRLRKDLTRLESRVSALEAELAEIERLLADPEVLSDRERLAAIGVRHLEVQEELAWQMREWEDLAERVDGSVS